MAEEYYNTPPLRHVRKRSATLKKLTAVRRIQILCTAVCSMAETRGWTAENAAHLSRQRQQKGRRAFVIPGSLNHETLQTQRVGEWRQGPRWTRPGVIATLFLYRICVWMAVNFVGLQLLCWRGRICTTSLDKKTCRPGHGVNPFPRPAIVSVRQNMPHVYSSNFRVMYPPGHTPSNDTAV